MSQIDLKHATVYVEDGYTGPGGDSVGAIDNVAGYALGASVLTVDGFVGALAVNDVVTIAGSVVAAVLTKHRITAHTETSTNTTSITVTPALSAAVVDGAVITVLPHQLEIKVGEGNLSYSEKRNIEYVLNRGKLETVRQGDEVPVDVKFDFIWDFIRADTPQIPTIEDALKQRGQAANWVSSSSDQCEPYAVNIIIYYVPPCSTEDPETITISDYRWEELSHDFKAGQVSSSGKANITEATSVRA